MPLQFVSHQRARGQWERMQEPSKNGIVDRNHLHMNQGSQLHPIFTELRLSTHSHDFAI